MSPFGKACWAVLLCLLAACGGPPSAKDEIASTPTERGHGDAEAPRSEARRVIMVVLDAARADRMSFLGYPTKTMPNLEAFARQGVVFQRHYAQGADAQASIASLFQSRYFADPLFSRWPGVPQVDPAVVRRRPDPDMLSMVTAFRDAGFTTQGISALPWAGAESPFAQSFDGYVDMMAEQPPGNHRVPAAWQVIERANAWLEAHRDDDFFLYLHLMDANPPYGFGRQASGLFGKRPRPNDAIAAGGYPWNRKVPLTGENREYMDALYDGSLREIDLEIASLLNLLRRERLLEGTLMVFVGSHGQNLLHVSGRFGRSMVAYEAMAHVPLVITRVGVVPPQRVDRLTENVDVMPTMLGIMGVPVPAGKVLDGRPLLVTVSGDETTGDEATGDGPSAGVDANDAAGHAMVSGGVVEPRYKLLFKAPRGELFDPAQEAGVILYDLAADPRETQDVSASHGDVVARMRRAYRTTLKAPFERFSNSIQTAPPSEPFAIAAADFQHRGSALDGLSPGDLPRLIEQELEPTQWQVVQDAERSMLIAPPGAAPLSMLVPLPEGQYRLRIASSGVGRVRLTAPGWRGRSNDLNSPRPPADRPWNTTVTDVGHVVVRDGHFRCVLSNRGQGLFFVQYLLFDSSSSSSKGP